MASLPFGLSVRSLVKIAAAASLALSIAACSNTADQLADATGSGAGGGYGSGGPATPGSARDFVVNVGDRVFFESDSSDLTSTATATLDRQAQWLTRYPRYSFIVEGHADERGTREYNYSLGARRSQTVRDYLTSKGLSGSRMRTVSYGKERPVAVCNDISCWSQNRRAVINLEGGANS